MTEELPWGSGGSSETIATPPEEGSHKVRRQATMVGDREPDWSQLEPPGEWVQAEPAPVDVLDPAQAAPQRAETSGWFEPPAAPSSGYTTRRQLREARMAAGEARASSAPHRARTPAPDPGTQHDDLAGSPRRELTTAELALYRPPPDVAVTSPPLSAVVTEWAGPLRAADVDQGRGPGAGGRAKRGVERWSRWAAGLGLPPRDRSGRRRYVEGLLPPAVWLVVALGVAVFAGLLTGVLVSAGGSGGGSVQTAVATTTLTVTNEQTTTATTTATQTTTRTVTSSPLVQDTAQAGQNGPATQPAVQNGQRLGPGSQGAQVFLLQQGLAQLGLLQGPPTGVYDEATRAAVQNFQARAGVTADPPGIAGPATTQALRQALGR